MMSREGITDAGFPMDPLELQQGKVTRLQNQIQDIENQMFERSKLLRQIERLKREEDARAMRVLSRLSGKTPLLTDEMTRFYGAQTALDYSDTPINADIMGDILTHRTKEHALAQQEKEMQIKYLTLEKRRLQEARERLQDKKQFLARNATPPIERNLSDLVPEVMMTPPKVKSPSVHSVHSQGSLIKRTIKKLPQSINRIWNLREDIEADYKRKHKPYTGHLGLESYLPYQLEDYVIVRKLVEDFVNETIRTHIIPDHKSRVDPADVANWMDMSGNITDRKMLQLIMEELLLEQTRKFSTEVAEDVLFLNGILRNRTDVTLINQAERISTGTREGRDPEDPAYNTVTQGYFNAVDNRDERKREVWGHSQHLQKKSKMREEPERPQPSSKKPTTKKTSDPRSPKPVESDEQIDDDTEVLSFDHITHVSLRKYKPEKTDSKEQKKYKINTERYIGREIRYWESMSREIMKVSISRKCKGVECVKLSAENTLLAVGTVHGDIIVYDIKNSTWKVIRLVHNAGSVDDSVVDIAWSLDNTKISTINKLGSLQIWTLEGGLSGKTDARSLDVQFDNVSNLPLQLARLTVLDDDVQDFAFKQGTFSQQGVLDGTNSPIKSAFYPSLTLLGSQHSVCVALDNGDMLKCNLEPFSTIIQDGEDQEYEEIPKIYQENIYSDKFGVNLIGQNIEAELYRQHKHPLIFLGFINNLSRIVTVDQKCFINIWNYDSLFLCKFGWFIPFKKLKVDLSKTVYVPADTTAPNVKFTDIGKSKKKSQKEIARERRRVQNLLDNMMLGDPWHEEYIEEQGLVTSIYAPRGTVKETGALFNVIIRHKATDQISSYLTRMYKPVKVVCRKVIDVQQTTDGLKLVFVLLFPEYPPKNAHLTVVVLNLLTMRFEDLRADIPLTSVDYNQLLQHASAHFSVSKVLAATGSDYLFLCLNGKVQTVSLNTGSVVMRTDNTDRVLKYPGLIIEQKTLPVTKTSKVAFYSTTNTLNSIYYSPKSTDMYVLKIDDENTSTDRKWMAKSFQIWGQRPSAPVERRVNYSQYTPSNNQSIEVDMKELVLECVDKALRKKGEQIGPDDLLQNREEAYSALLKEVQRRNLLQH